MATAVAVAAFLAGLSVEATLRLIEACSAKIEPEIKIEPELDWHGAMERHANLNTLDTGVWIEIGF